MLNTGRIFRFIGPDVHEVISKVAWVVLAAMDVQPVFVAVTKLEVIPLVAGHRSLVMLCRENHPSRELAPRTPS